MRARAEWGYRETRRLLQLQAAQVRGLAIHWPGHKPGSAPIVDVPRALQAYQRQHVGANGWSAIAYQVAVDQRGEVWELRGLTTRSAANGSNAANTGYGAVLALLVPGEQPSQAMLAALREVVREFRRHYPKGTRIVTHNDVRPEPTACPGPAMTDAIRRGVLDPDRMPEIVGQVEVRPAPPRPAPPAAPPYPGTPKGYRRSTRRVAAVRTWQQRMRDRGWRIGVDGVFGPETERVLRAFQTEKRLQVDGVLGPRSWAAAWTSPVT